MKVWMRVNGGWDISVDEVPRPQVVEDLDREIDSIWETYSEQVAYQSSEFHDNLPEKLSDQIQELLEEGEQDEGTLFDKQAKERLKRAFDLFKKHIIKTGHYEPIFEWSSSEGEFYGLFLIEIPEPN